MRLKLPVPRSPEHSRRGVGGPALNYNLLVRVPILLITIAVLLFSFSPTNFVGAKSYYDRLLELQRLIKEYQAKITNLQGQERTLKNEIAYLDTQIYLTQLEIEEAETEIKLLGEDIGDLSQRLERIASFLEFQEKTFVARARSAYISDQLSSFDIILGSENLDEAMRQIKYLKVLEAQDREVLEQIRETRADYNAQKALLEEKKADVEELKRKVEAKKVGLGQQRADRAYLLLVTQSNEERYKRLLEQQKAEFAAIQAALATQGTPIGPVSRHQIIAWEGNTGCVCSYRYGCNPQPWPYGSHVHFMVVRNGVFVNPLPYLNSKTLGWPEDMSSAEAGPYFSSSHPAIDIAYPFSYPQYLRPIFAAERGNAYRFQDARPYCSWGNNGGKAYGVKIIHNNGLITLYYHVQPLE